MDIARNLLKVTRVLTCKPLNPVDRQSPRDTYRDLSCVPGYLVTRFHPVFIQDVNTHGRLMLANGQHESSSRFTVHRTSCRQCLCMRTLIALRAPGDKVVYSQTYVCYWRWLIVDEEDLLLRIAAVEFYYPYSSLPIYKTLGNRAVISPDVYEKRGSPLCTAKKARNTT